MQVRVGTSGYSYKEWKGRFYPDDLPAKKMLAYYGTRLDSVEINNTFYRMPRTEVLESWGYLRLRDQYGDEALAAWARKVTEQPWDEAYVYFKHEDEGAGPAMAERFVALTR